MIKSSKHSLPSMSMGEVRTYNLDNDIRYALFKFVLKHHGLKTRDMRSADSKQYIELNI